MNEASLTEPGLDCLELPRSSEPLEPENDLTPSEAREGRVGFRDRFPFILSQSLGLAGPNKVRTVWDRLIVFECRYDVWNQIQLQGFCSSNVEHGARVILHE